MFMNSIQLNVKACDAFIDNSQAVLRDMKIVACTSKKGGSEKKKRHILAHNQDMWHLWFGVLDLNRFGQIMWFCCEYA